MMKWIKRLKRKQIILLMTCLLMVLGTSIFFLVQNLQASSVDAGPSYEPATITRGSFTITVSGTGILMASDEVSLGFTKKGVIESIAVTPGDVVSEGDPLAQLADLDELSAEVTQLEMAAKKAQADYDYALNHPEVARAEAQATLAAANLAVEDAQKGLHQAGEGRCPEETTYAYYLEMREYEDQAAVWQGYLENGSGYGHDFILEHLNPLLEKYRLAYINWQYCQGYTNEEITDSELSLGISQAQQSYAQAIVDQINNTNGVDEETLAILKAEAAVANLQVELTKTQLEGSVITAPCDGLITAVNASVDEEVDGAEIITIARASTPVVQFIIDESDYTYMTKGIPGQVVFTALPDKTFTGRVSRVDLGMDSSFGFASIKGQFTLDNSPYFKNVTLPYGMMGTITMQVKEVNQAILVPVGAVLSASDGTPYVYLLNGGTPIKQEIEVDVQGDTYFEVLSGLQEGDLVATRFDEISTTY